MRYKSIYGDQTASFTRICSLFMDVFVCSGSIVKKNSKILFFSRYTFYEEAIRCIS